VGSWTGACAEWGRGQSAGVARILYLHFDEYACCGVDIDPQAVEVTKLSLLLKVLEGESEQTLQTQIQLFHERALPDLSRNIQCGNSLIGPDFYVGQQTSLFDQEERYRINVFDWEMGFPWLQEAGGTGRCLCVTWRIGGVDCGVTG
jgi:hypothetical protein